MEQQIEYNEEYGLSKRLYTVKTDLGTLLKLRTIVKGLGMEKFFMSGEVSSNDVIKAAMNALGDSGLLNEFCQVVTGTKDNFMEADIGTIMWILHDFFASMYWQMPVSWRQGLQVSIQTIMELGKAKVMGWIPASAGTTAEEAGTTA